MKKLYFILETFSNTSVVFKKILINNIIVTDVISLINSFQYTRKCDILVASIFIG